MRRLIPALLIIGCLSAMTPPRAGAAPPATQPSAGESGAELRIYLMTFSPGSIIYERFGHDTIVVHDPNPSAERIEARREFDESFFSKYGGYPRGLEPLLPTDRAHHFGAFDFDKGFVPRFAMGRMQYWTVSDWADLTALLYGHDNREVLLQELNLTAAQKLELKRFLEWNELPENRTYRYDYYRDNCSTRIRDSIDRVLGGALKEQLQAKPTATTYRSHTRRLTSGLDPLDLFWFTAFTYILGQPTDVPLSAWEEAFLPGKLAEHVRGVTVTDAAGRAAPLVLSEQLLSRTTRTPMPERPPRRTVAYLVAGVVMGGAFLLLAKLARRRTPDPESAIRNPKSAIKTKQDGGEKAVRPRAPLATRLARLAFALLIVPWVLLWGVGGLIATFTWAFTDHAASYRNENLLQFSPLILPLAVLGPMLALRRRRGAKAAVVLGLVIGGLSVLGLLLKVLPMFWQQNAEILALGVPSNLGLAAAILVLAQGLIHQPTK
jgi:hypothetical protein